MDEPVARRGRGLAVPSDPKLSSVLRPGVVCSVATQASHRSEGHRVAMATNLVNRGYGRSLLLDLLDCAGWRLQIRDGETVRLCAARHQVELVGAPGTVFARAMRSGGGHHRDWAE